jgi:co-chaperonin GroES (HSP10)
MSKPVKLLKAYGAKVLLEIEAVEKMTEGGIELPDEIVRREQDEITEGKLVSLGEIAFDEMLSKENYPPIGTTLHFIRFAGVEIKRNGKFYRIVNDIDIYGGEED